MGQTIALLLVKCLTALGLAALLVLGACHKSAPGKGAPADGAPTNGINAGRVDPLAYDSYFLWPGIRPPQGSAPKVLYLLDGEIRRDGPARFVRLRPGTPHLPGKQLWLVVRAERLDWTPAIHSALLADLARWQQAGNNVAGLQVDFDAATRGIGGYAQFLARLRQQLPRPWRLSITGLMDWSAHGDPQALAALRPVVDEVVIQTYQGRSTIPGYEAYFARMAHFPIPFRVAVVEGGLWQAPAMLAQQPNFRGYAVFLLTKPRR